MIVTVTLNAALDRTLVAPGFTLGTSRTVAHGLSLAGGKGLNVARALRALGCPVLALGFVGGLTGERMRRALADEGLQHALTAIEGESRTCTAIVDPEIGAATEINEPGPTIRPGEVVAFLASFIDALPRARLVCLCGSLPTGVSDDFYAGLIERAREAGVPCILDSRGAALRHGMRAVPLLAKPNRVELAELLGANVDPLDAAAVRRAVPNPSPPALAITLGPDGAVLYGESGVWHALPPAVRVVDTVGAGDAFVAGLAAGLVREAGGAELAATLAQPGVPERILTLATATAVANTLTIGAGRLEPRDVERLNQQVVSRAM
jgi:tagatose 6-phosphate kinase